MNENERNALFANWLRKYSHEAIMRAMARRDEIVQNDHAMMMLRELLEREADEAKDFERSIDMLFRDFDTFEQYDPHNHALSHSEAYRAVLYDMYIAPEHESE